MSKIYVFGIGGTGSRVLRSLTMLLASGVELGNGIDTVVPIIIDPDASNGNLTDTVDFLGKYESIRRHLRFDGAEKNKFFSTKVEPLENGEFILPILDTNSQTFAHFLGQQTLGQEDDAMVRMLFSEANLESDMRVGFKGNPNIGSVVLEQVFESDTFTAFANGFTQGDRIFIISSIFGGTGASGFPMLLNTLNKSEKFQNASLIQKAVKGAVTVLPYFKVKADMKEDQAIDSGTFISKTKSALAYYENSVGKGIEDLYFLADNEQKVYEYSDGGNQQKNAAHYIEFLAATAIVDFTKKHAGAADNEELKPAYHEFGYDNTQGSQTALNFMNFYKTGEVYKSVYKPLTQWALCYTAMEHDGEYLREQLDATKDIKENLYSSDSFGEIETFVALMAQWHEEMRGNKNPLDLFMLSEKPKDPFEIVVGKTPKKDGFLSMKKKYEKLRHELNKQGQKVEQKLKEDNPTAFFMEMMWRATEELFNDKLK